MDKKERFLEENSLDGGFLQSVHWVAFQRELGKTFYLTESSKNKTLVIENKLPVVGKYFYIPRGPVFSDDEEDNQLLLENIKKIAIKNRASWIRVEPQRKEDLKKFKGWIVKARKNHQSSETLVIDLKKDLDQILAEMKSKTRYNIRLAEKKEVEVRISENLEDLDIFWKLTQETAIRDGVSFHNSGYYKKMFKAVPRDNLELLVASSGEQPVGAIIVSYFGGVATYLHGASSDKDRNLMANYFLQWEAIKRAKEKGAIKYDFFGIAVELNKKKWAGITRFKKGFRPNCAPVVFPGCYDLILCPLKYWIYRILQLLKR